MVDNDPLRVTNTRSLNFPGVDQPSRSSCIVRKCHVRSNRLEFARIHMVTIGFAE